jgi:hypothetical protein
MKMVCTTCETVGEPKKATKGSFLIEVFLWLCFLVPGLIYSLWRLTSKQTVCPVCRASTLVPLYSPAGKRITGNQDDQTEQKPKVKWQA